MLSTTCELLHNCTVSSGNRGIPVGNYEFVCARNSYLRSGITDANSIYGNKITCWDVSEVTDMTGAFSSKPLLMNPFVGMFPVLHQ
jgi:hypothetical protein